MRWNARRKPLTCAHRPDMSQNPPSAAERRPCSCPVATAVGRTSAGVLPSSGHRRQHLAYGLVLLTRPAGISGCRSPEMGPPITFDRACRRRASARAGGRLVVLGERRRGRFRRGRGRRRATSALLRRARPVLGRPAELRQFGLRPTGRDRRPPSPAVRPLALGHVPSCSSLGLDRGLDGPGGVGDVGDAVELRLTELPRGRRGGPPVQCLSHTRGHGPQAADGSTRCSRAPRTRPDFIRCNPEPGTAGARYGASTRSADGHACGVRRCAGPTLRWSGSLLDRKRRTGSAGSESRNWSAARALAMETQRNGRRSPAPGGRPFSVQVWLSEIGDGADRGGGGGRGAWR